MMKKLFTLFIAITLFTSAKAQWVTIPDTNFVNWFNNNGFNSCVSGNNLDTTCSVLTSITILNINSSKIKEYQGLQYFKNLRCLTLTGIADTCLKSYLPKSITTLTITSPDTIFKFSNTALPNLDTLVISNSSSLNFFNNCILPSTLKNLFLWGHAAFVLPNLPNGLEFLYSYYGNDLKVNSFPSSVKKIICEHNNGVKYLPKLPDSLIYLDVSNCSNLRRLDSLPNKLIYLDASYCRRLKFIDSIPPSVFQLNVTYDSIANLNFRGNNNLYYLNCSYTQINSFSFLPQRIRTLIANNTKLTSLPIFPNVQHLDISYCKIAYLPLYQPTMRFPDSLHYFNFRDNLISGFPSQLDFRNTLIDTIIGDKANSLTNSSFTSILLPSSTVYVSLSYNKINWIAIDSSNINFYNPNFYLNLSHNNLSNAYFIDNWIYSAKYPLLTVDLSYNNIGGYYVSLAGTLMINRFNNAKNEYYLSSFNLSHNQIVTYDLSIWVTTGDAILNVSYNNIFSIYGIVNWPNTWGGLL